MDLPAVNVVWSDEMGLVFLIKKGKLPCLNLNLSILNLCLASCLQIRLAEARLQGNQQNMQPEQLEKMAKMEEWRKELKLLEDRKTNLVP